MCKIVRMICSILKRTLGLIAHGESVSNARNVLSRTSAALENSRHGSAVLGRVCGILRSKRRCRTLIMARTQHNVTL